MTTFRSLGLIFLFACSTRSESSPDAAVPALAAPLGAGPTAATPVCQ